MAALLQGAALATWAREQQAAKPRKQRKKTGRLSRLTPLLHVGNRSAAQDATLLDAHGIQAIVNVGGGHAAFPGRFAYLRRVLPDHPDADMLSIFPELCGAIDAHIRAGRGVLVHCMGGISRSPTVCTAYLVRHRALSLEEALATVKAGRRTARPNPGFLTQLRRWEARCRHAP